MHIPIHRRDFLRGTLRDLSDEQAAENAYGANARVMTAVRDLFDELMKL